MIAEVVEHEATLVGVEDPKQEKHPTMVPEETVAAF